MFKLLRLMVLLAMLYGAFQIGCVVHDRNMLSEEIIRLHVVADSDSQEDQALKLQVRDAVVQWLEEAMEQMGSAQEAKAFLSSCLDEIQSIAENVITTKGQTDEVKVTLTQEAFDIREYDTFTLPAGVYESLRIVIGDGEGENWWCVVFPSLCAPHTTASFQQQAVGAGFSQTLTQTVSNEQGYEIRFWVLDWLGKVQKFFFES